jgi:hypothetical protein
MVMMVLDSGEMGGKSTPHATVLPRYGTGRALSPNMAGITQFARVQAGTVTCFLWRLKRGRQEESRVWFDKVNPEIRKSFT